MKKPEEIAWTIFDLYLSYYALAWLANKNGRINQNALQSLADSISCQPDNLRDMIIMSCARISRVKITRKIDEKNEAIILKKFIHFFIKDQKVPIKSPDRLIKWAQKFIIRYKLEDIELAELIKVFS